MVLTSHEMSRDAISQFRITCWPAQLPHPGFEYSTRGWEYREDLQSFVIPSDWPANSKPEPVPMVTGEAYLELCAVDLADVNSIRAFVDRYGTLELRYSEHGMQGERPMFGFYMQGGWPPISEGLDDDYEVAASKVPGGVLDLCPLSEFRYGALCMRDLVTAARVVRGELASERAEWVSPVWAHQPEVPHEEYPWRQDHGPGFLLDTYLSGALESFSPVVRTHPMTWQEDSRPLTQSDFTLWQVLCLELFNHLARDTGYKQCANERCARLFVKQSGRSLHGQHRSTGVKYCSVRCSRAQANRAYRRRRVGPSDSRAT